MLFDFYLKISFTIYFLSGLILCKCYCKWHLFEWNNKNNIHLNPHNSINLTLFFTFYTKYGLTRWDSTKSTLCLVSIIYTFSRIIFYFQRANRTYKGEKYFLFFSLHRFQKVKFLLWNLIYITKQSNRIQKRSIQQIQFKYIDNKIESRSDKCNNLISKQHKKINFESKLFHAWGCKLTWISIT